MENSMNLYLSRLLLNPHSRQVWSETASPYEMHRTLMRAFPKVTTETKSKARSEFDVLFRFEVGSFKSFVKVYVQSSHEPNWSFLESLDNYLWPVSGTQGFEYKDIMPSYQTIQMGQILRFRLRANPTKRIGRVIKGDSALKGKRVGLPREEQQIGWLVRKGLDREDGKPGGFEIVMKNNEGYKGVSKQVPCINIYPENKQKGRIEKGSHALQTTHLAVCFEGLLRVTDAHAFRETLVKGVGPGKAFGFGLLSVAPTDL